MPCLCSDFLRWSPSAWAPRSCLAQLSLRCMPALSRKQVCYYGPVGCFIFMSARCSRSPAALRTGASASTEQHLRQSLDGALPVPFRNSLRLASCPGAETPVGVFLVGNSLIRFSHCVV